MQYQYAGRATIRPQRRWRALWLLLSALVVACAQAPPEPEPGPPPVGDVVLLTAETPPPEALQLNIGVRVFDNRSERQAASHSAAAVFAEIREMESHYLPVVLRNTLVAANEWGVVRVLPEADPSVDLLIEGTIIESDGMTLTLHIRAVDSSGREWLNDTYRDVAETRDYPDFVPSVRNPPAKAMADPFQDLHSRIANDLLLARHTLDAQALRSLIRISYLKYAEDLSPETFSGMLGANDAGELVVERMPADNDPMLRRVAAMRLRHHIFIDTIDEYYDALHVDVKPIYDIWRQYSHDQLAEEHASELRARDGRSRSGGSFAEVSRNYDRYKWARLFEQEFFALASGFVNESAPAVLELNRSVHGLSGSVEEQYAQWRDLLRALFEVETGAR